MPGPASSPSHAPRPYHDNIFRRFSKEIRGIVGDFTQPYSATKTSYDHILHRLNDSGGMPLIFSNRTDARQRCDYEPACQGIVKVSTNMDADEYRPYGMISKNVYELRGGGLKQNDEEDQEYEYLIRDPTAKRKEPDASTILPQPLTNLPVEIVGMKDASKPESGARFASPRSGPPAPISSAAAPNVSPRFEMGTFVNNIIVDSMGSPRSSSLPIAQRQCEKTPKCSGILHMSDNTYDLRQGEILPVKGGPYTFYMKKDWMPVE